MCDEYADNQRKKSQVWPLQSTLLILCPVCGLECCVCSNPNCAAVMCIAHYKEKKRRNQGKEKSCRLKGSLTTNMYMHSSLDDLEYQPQQLTKNRLFSLIVSEEYTCTCKFVYLISAYPERHCGEWDRHWQWPSQGTGTYIHCTCIHTR